MFRPKIETPIAKAEQPVQITGSWIAASVIAPMFRSLYSAAIAGCVGPYVVGALKSLVTHEDFSDPANILRAIGGGFPGWFLIGLAVFWFGHAGGGLWVIDMIERLLNIEIDHQDTRKRLDGTPVGHILMEPWKGQAAAELDARNRERVRMEQFIREAWRDSTTRNLDRKFGERWHQWKNMLLDANWIIIDEPGRRNSTWHLRVPPDETIAGCFGMEIEDVEKKRATNR